MYREQGAGRKSEKGAGMLSICLDAARLNAWVLPTDLSIPRDLRFAQGLLAVVVHSEACLLVSDTLVGDVTSLPVRCTIC